MKYNKVKKGIFIKREKRFIGYVEFDGEVHKVHVKQTGRCEELLIPGVTVYVETATNPNRKTKYTLIAVIKPNGRLVNIDSQIPNKMFHEALEEGLQLPDFKSPYKITPESTYGNSRFDFKLELKSAVDNSNEKSSMSDTAWVEVKGVTLEDGGMVLFPDAPTERGLKHINELIKAKEDGYNAYAVFIVQMKDVKGFGPNMITHPEFGYALSRAKAAGVKLIAFDSVVTPDTIKLGNPVPITNLPDID